MVVAVVVDVERVGTRVNECGFGGCCCGFGFGCGWGVVVVRNGEEGGGCLVSLGGLEHKLRALQTRQ